MKSKYSLSFISDNDLSKHVRETVQKYRFNINFKEFNKNIIDPIKLTFDSKIYGKSIEAIVETESIRQIDKSNTNHIGYFHQNIFKYMGSGWDVPEKSYDIVNESRKIFVKMINKRDTMNSSSTRKTFLIMQSEILKNNEATCYLVEVIAEKSQDIIWKVNIDGEQFSHKNIRQISIDKFYELVTGDPTAFKKLCEVIPKVLDDTISKKKDKGIFE